MNSLFFLWLALGTPQTIEARMTAILDEVRIKENIPGLAAAVIRSEGPVYVAVSGKRRQDADARLTREDRMHIGSCTKAITSTLMARLVADRILAWDTQLLEVFPELKGKLHPAYQHINLRDLLSHTAGVVPSGDFEPWLKNHPPDVKALAALKGDAAAQRLAMLVPILSMKPVVAPKTALSYSNAGYAIAAAMAERRTGKTWEWLIESKVLKPLGMPGMHVGWPGALKSLKQPVGHVRDNGTFRVCENDEIKLPLSLTPAGHLSGRPEDLALFLRLHLRGLRDLPTIMLDPAMFTLIHQPVKEDYGLGWGKYRNRKGVLVPWHNGSIGSYVTQMVVMPGDDLAVATFSNAGMASEPATVRAAQRIIRLFDE